MKTLTRDQIQSRKDQAVRVTRDVLDDPDRADEIEDESLEDYAERRKFTITNPNRTGSTYIMANGKTKADLEAQIEDLEAENQDLQDQLDAIADIVGGGDDDSDDGNGDDSGDGNGDDDDDDDGDDANGDDDQD